MANQLFIHFHVNEKVLMPDVRKGKVDHFLEVFVDGRPYGKMTADRSYPITDGFHHICLRYYREDRYGSTCDVSKETECMISGNNAHFTLNVYFLREDRIELLPGNVPFDEEKGKPKGCYVATCVYGSYDCPEVWVLRRYRDYTLRETWYGRSFIKVYYVISPKLVEWFGKTHWFKSICQKRTDKLVARLRSEGVEDTPYQDK